MTGGSDFEQQVAEHGARLAAERVEQPQDWLFTFGANHTHPDTGQRLGRSYVRIHGTCDSTRHAINQAFGNRWSMQYSNAERAGVEKYGLVEVSMPGGAVVEERTEEQTQRCPNCAPGYDCERGIYVPADSAQQIEALRRQIGALRDVNEALAVSVGAAHEAHEAVRGEVALLRRWVERAGSDEGDEPAVAALDRIEHHIAAPRQVERGERG